MKKKQGILLFLAVTVISIILAIYIEPLKYWDEYIVITPGWTFRLYFGIVIGLISLLIYYFAVERREKEKGTAKIKLSHQKLTEVILLLIFFLQAGIATSQTETFKGVDPQVFSKQSGYIEEGEEEVCSPDKRWCLGASGHLWRRQGGFRGVDISNGPYTLTCARPDYLKNSTRTWAHLLFYPFHGELAEKYSCSEDEIEKRIEKERDHRLQQIIRIDKIRPNFYIVTYASNRGAYKYSYPKEAKAYNPIYLGEKASFRKNDILFDVPVTVLSPHYEKGATLKEGHRNIKRMKLSVEDILYLNPEFLKKPAELENVVIPYTFFDKHFIYEYSDIKEKVVSVGDPMVIKLGEKGITVRFYKSPEYDEL